MREGELSSQTQQMWCFSDPSQSTGPKCKLGKRYVNLNISRGHVMTGLDLSKVMRASGMVVVFKECIYP